MKEVAKLILDGQNHKVMIQNGEKLSKLTIGSIDELSLPAAKSIIQEINELVKADYNYQQITTLLEIAELYPLISKYSHRSLKVLSKLKSEEVTQEIQVDSLNTKEKTVVLNIGCTASGKTKFNVSSIIPKPYQKGFATLSSIKESTNWTVGYEINHPEKGIDEGFEVMIELKEDEQVQDNLRLQILESIQEIFSQIDKLLSAKQTETIDEAEIWALAVEAGFQRLKVNKDKTFDIAHLVTSGELKYEFEQLLLKGIREFSTSSTSYEKKLSNEQLVETLISNYQELGSDFKLEEFFAFVQKNKEYDGLLKKLLELVQASLDRFKEYYRLEGNQQKIILKETFDIDANKKLLKSVFGSKRDSFEKEYFTIEMLVKKVTFYFINKHVNEGKHTILYDGLGINQGQLDSDNEKDIALKRVNKAIYEAKPDLIIYHTRLESKDNLMINVMNELEIQGYRGRLYIIYGRGDVVLKQFCEEDDLDFSSISENELSQFDDFVYKQYIWKDLISLVDDYEGRIYICDKTANLTEGVAETSLVALNKYLPQPILNDIIKHFKETHQQTREKINKKKAEKIIGILDEKQVFSSVYSEFTNAIQNSIPMEYQKLRWNTLECALRELTYDYLGFRNIYPTVDLRRAYAKHLNNTEELAEYLGEDYNEFLREFLDCFMKVTNSLIITINKFEYNQLFNLRFNIELRNMKSVTITEERKILLKSVLLTSLENDKVVGAASIRNITRNVLESMSI